MDLPRCSSAELPSWGWSIAALFFVLALNLSGVFEWGAFAQSMTSDLSVKGRYADGLELDKRLIQLRPHDALAHYNLACSYALLKKPDLALKTLRRAVELGYRDFRYMREDRDLESVRHDPRFRQLLREFEHR